MDEEYTRLRRKRANRPIPTDPVERAQYLHDSTPVARGCNRVHVPEGWQRDYLPPLGEHFVPMDIDLTPLFASEGFPEWVQFILTDIYSRSLRISVERNQPEWGLVAVLFHEDGAWSVNVPSGDVAVTGIGNGREARDLVRAHYGW